MAKLDQSQNAYYPSPSKTGPLDNDFRLLFDHMHDQRRRNAELSARLDEMTKSHKALSDQVAQGPSNTKIGGLNVKAAVPTNGQTLKYNSASGEIEWT